MMRDKSKFERASNDAYLVDRRLPRQESRRLVTSTQKKQSVDRKRLIDAAVDRILEEEPQRITPTKKVSNGDMSELQSAMKGEKKRVKSRKASIPEEDLLSSTEHSETGERRRRKSKASIPEEDLLSSTEHSETGERRRRKSKSSSIPSEGQQLSKSSHGEERPKRRPSRTLSKEGDGMMDNLRSSSNHSRLSRRKSKSKESSSSETPTKERKGRRRSKELLPEDLPADNSAGGSEVAHEGKLKSFFNDLKRGSLKRMKSGSSASGDSAIQALHASYSASDDQQSNNNNTTPKRKSNHSIAPPPKSQLVPSGDSTVHSQEPASPKSPITVAEVEDTRSTSTPKSSRKSKKSGSARKKKSSEDSSSASTSKKSIKKKLKQASPPPPPPPAATASVSDDESENTDKNTNNVNKQQQREKPAVDKGTPRSKPKRTKSEPLTKAKVAAGRGPGGMGLQRAKSGAQGPAHGPGMGLQRAPSRTGGKGASLREVANDPPPQRELPSTSYFSSNHVMVNRERIKAGLHPLRRNVTLDEAACAHAKRMAEAGILYPLPRNLDGNVMVGSGIRSIHKTTMLDENSERERDNMLNPDFKDFGMGTSKGKDGQLYLCQLYAA